MKKLLLLLVLSLVFVACSLTDDDEIPQSNLKDAKEFVYQVMYNYYYWDETIPESDEIDMELYSDEFELLDTLRYTENGKVVDKWSYVEDSSTDDMFYDEGQYLGMGFQQRYSDDGNYLLISNVYNDSPAARAGMKRGTKISKINGKTIAQITEDDEWDTIYGEDTEGVEVSMELYNTTQGEGPYEVTLTKSVVTIDTVTDINYYTVGNKKVAYMAFNSFITPASPLLDAAFTEFVNKNVDELVLDLRYNGGGYLSIASAIGGYINTEDTRNKVFQTLIYDSKVDQKHTIEWFAYKENSLNLNRVFILTTGNTASASEAVINGLRPFIDVYLIGQTTYGKPVGMNGYKNTELNLTIWPVTFKGQNANGEGEFFDGFTPDKEVEDSLDYNLGDPNELMLKEALYFIQYDQFSAVSGVLAEKKAIKKEVPKIHQNGLKGYFELY